MNHASLGWRCALLALLSAAPACQRAPESIPPRSPAPAVAGSLDARGTLDAGGALAPLSLYHLDLTLQDQHQREWPLRSLRGQPVLVALFYASCPHACPLLLGQLKRLWARSPASKQRRLQVLLVSLDGERDTASALRAQQERLQVDGATWRFTRTSPDGVRALAAALDVKYQRLPDGGFNHSSVVVLLDGEGVPSARSEGPNENGDAVLAALEALP